MMHSVMSLKQSLTSDGVGHGSIRRTVVIRFVAVGVFSHYQQIKFAVESCVDFLVHGKVFVRVENQGAADKVIESRAGYIHQD